jgi:hypothetical protein
MFVGPAAGSRPGELLVAGAAGVGLPNRPPGEFAAGLADSGELFSFPGAHREAARPCTTVNVMLDVDILDVWFFSEIWFRVFVLKILIDWLF